jgi:hypothetical protein
MYQCFHHNVFDAGTFDKTPNLKALSFVENGAPLAFPEDSLIHLLRWSTFTFLATQLVVSCQLLWCMG